MSEIVSNTMKTATNGLTSSGVFDVHNLAFDPNYTNQSAVPSTNNMVSAPSPVISYLGSANGDGMRSNSTGSQSGYNQNMTPEQNTQMLSNMDKAITDPTSFDPNSLPNGLNSNGLDFGRLQDLQKQAQDNKELGMYGSGILGAAQLGLGIYDAIGKNNLNNKNMQLVDQQIAQNRQVMSDRTQRNADIAKAFGSGGVMSTATGL